MFVHSLQGRLDETYHPTRLRPSSSTGCKYMRFTATELSIADQGLGFDPLSTSPLVR